MGLGDRDVQNDLVTCRQAAQESACPCDMILDLPASRPRLGETSNRIFLPGELVVIRDAGSADGDVMPLPGLSQFLPSIKPGERLFFRDGRTTFEIVGVGTHELQARCLQCTEAIASGNGCSFPDSDVVYDAIRPEDAAFLEQLASKGEPPEWILLSLIDHPEQVHAARQYIERLWPEGVALMAKIETAGAAGRIEAITEVADGLLLGRGDLLITLPPEEMPRVQREVAAAAKKHLKPWTLATQVFERFAETGRPYRAELNDAALAVAQHAAAIVLCQETNDSPRPIDTVAAVKRIIDAERCA